MGVTKTKVKTNFKPVIERLKGLAHMTPLQKRIVTKVMGTVALEQVDDRVERGVGTNGTPFKAYSDKPAYFSVKRGLMKKLKPPWGKEYGGKRRKRFASGKRKGKAHRSRYLPKGYSELRKLTGRSTDNNRLLFTGKMMANMSVDIYGKEGAYVHFPRKQENDKACGNEEKYKFFFSNSPDRDEQAKEGKFMMEHIMAQEGFKKT